MQSRHTHYAEQSCQVSSSSHASLGRSRCVTTEHHMPPCVLPPGDHHHARVSPDNSNSSRASHVVESSLILCSACIPGFMHTCLLYPVQGPCCCMWCVKQQDLGRPTRTVRVTACAISRCLQCTAVLPCKQRDTNMMKESLPQCYGHLKCQYMCKPKHQAWHGKVLH
jgi:hypothetical protein